LIWTQFWSKSFCFQWTNWCDKILIDYTLISSLNWIILFIKVVPNQIQFKTWSRSSKSINIWKTWSKLTDFQRITVFEITGVERESLVERGIHLGRKSVFLYEGGVLVVEGRLWLLIFHIRTLVSPSHNRTVEGVDKRSKESSKWSKEFLLFSSHSYQS